MDKKLSKHFSSDIKDILTIIKYFTDIMKLIQEEGNAKVTQQISTELLQVPTLKLTFNLASKKEIAVHLIWNRRTESQLLKLTQKKFVRHLKRLRLLCH